jgi:hypothetical protein
MEDRDEMAPKVDEGIERALEELLDRLDRAETLLALLVGETSTASAEQVMREHRSVVVLS